LVHPFHAQCRSIHGLAQFAKAKEAEGQLPEAADAFERGGDIDSAVRIYLLKLNNSNKAFALARRSGSTTAAATLVRYCLSKSQWAGAVEFHMLAGQKAEALQVAQTHSEMDTYASCLKPGTSADMQTKVALYFQNHKQHDKAALQYELAGSLTSAVSQLMAHSKQVCAVWCSMVCRSNLLLQAQQAGAALTWCARSELCSL
jgi:phage gp37-like protein